MGLDCKSRPTARHEHLHGQVGAYGANIRGVGLRIARPYTQRAWIANPDQRHYMEHPPDRDPSQRTFAATALAFFAIDSPSMKNDSLSTTKTCPNSTGSPKGLMLSK